MENQPKAMIYTVIRTRVRHDDKTIFSSKEPFVTNNLDDARVMVRYYNDLPMDAVVRFDYYESITDNNNPN